MRGPFALWMRLPAVADHTNRLAHALRRDGKLDLRLYRIAVLVVARHWGAQYEWYIHARGAIEAGVSAEVVESIRTGKQPAFTRANEEIAYDTVKELLETRTLSEPTYKRARNAFGEDALIELVTIAGFFTMAAMMLNAFDAPVPDGSRPLD